ncbi:S-type pyocin domain-containing protein [Pseudomonas sp. BBP2017]|uniref:S-type pyocin domain-containing protein n=1 Tax=Pseudomonas sp. BBP2017 TaxID=2109731 RepID=UPI000D11D465|nr:S-type pyocin domain-containing protein [Pseudomonas sp. BBP2017]PSS57376.1 S-type pyocin domain-containing protein [Pseudomonas sp. BBP2017]
MDGKTFNDNSTGDVVITPGSPGSSSGGGGFFSIGGGGGFGAGFGGSSRRRRKKRAKARAAALARAKAEEQARLEAVARAQAEARALAHRQLVNSYGQAREQRKAQLDQHFAGQAQGQAQALQAEIQAAKTSPDHDGSERWQLYLITKARNEINGLIAAKGIEPAQRQALAAAFDGQDPLAAGADTYASRLATLATAEHMQQLHRSWETAYTAAQEARLLAQAIETLSQRSTALAQEHAQQQEVWRAREAQWARQRQYAQLRETRIRFKQQADENLRQHRLKQANTLSMPVSAIGTGGVFLSRAGAQVVAGAPAALAQAVISVIKELARIAAIRAGQVVSLTATLLLYSPELGNGELSAAQRRRQLEGVGLPAELLGLKANQSLQAIADAGGTASIGHRLKVEHLQGGSSIALVSTGGDITTDIPVRNATFDPVTGAYRVDGIGLLDRTLLLGGATASSDPSAAPAGSSGFIAPDPQVDEVAKGVDLRFDDCIVCIPGQPPQYFSFVLPPAGTGVVSGKGVVADANWWAAGSGGTGAAIPVQVGNQLRARTYDAPAVFERALWQTIGADAGLLAQFDPINQKRILNGYPPIAAKASWQDGRREFELRHDAPVGLGAGLYDLDRIRIHPPISGRDVRIDIPAFTPWFARRLELAMDAALVQGQPARTWTPLVPPGLDTLGPTPLPEGPSLPGLLPGQTTDPLLPGSETLPGTIPGETGVTIPGFGGDTDLPSPGLVDYRPARPLEVGSYNDLRRRSINDRMDVDHIVSRKALEARLKVMYAGITPAQLKVILESAPSIVIPEEVHRKYSETYGGRNTISKQLSDASDLRAAVDNNMNALKPGLLDYGFSEAEIEMARNQLHELHMEKGLYE